MTIKDIFWNNTVKYTALGIGAVGAILIGGKLLYDYSMYSNLKYVKKQIKKINNEDN